MGWIKQLPALEQRDEDAQKTISDASQGTTVTVAARTQCRVVGAGGWISLGADAPPMIGRVAQTVVAGIPHRDTASAATLFCHGRKAHTRPKDVIGSGYRLRSFGEHSGGDARPDPWHGADNSDVRKLALVPRRWRFALQLFQQPFQVVLGVAPLSGHQLDSRQQQLQMLGDRLDHTRAVWTTGCCNTSRTCVAGSRRMR